MTGPGEGRLRDWHLHLRLTAQGTCRQPPVAGTAHPSKRGSGVYPCGHLGQPTYSLSSPQGSGWLGGLPDKEVLLRGSQEFSSTSGHRWPHIEDVSLPWPTTDGQLRPASTQTTSLWARTPSAGPPSVLGSAGSRVSSPHLNRGWWWTPQPSAQHGGAGRASEELGFRSEGRLTDGSCPGGRLLRRPSEENFQAY